MRRSLPVLGQSRGLRADGKREIIVPADVSGRLTLRRNLIFALLLVIYSALPWIEINGHPAVFLDLSRRAFYLFGMSFNAQDTWLSFFLVSGVGFSLIVMTTLWGRVWCGYACPQTVFLEGVYRRLERWIEGSKQLRSAREKHGITRAVVLRKTLKHGAFALVSLAVAHVFLSYFVSIPALLSMMQHAPTEHPEAFAWVLVVAGALHFNYVWFREQLCIVICPYGRLQSVLTDADTLVIGYDEQRGEPRGKANKAGAGDCVDCGRCVAVCPTGIDIRNGLQLECIGCSACVDACDEIMTRLERPTGLIRYDSQNGLTGQIKRVLRPRLYLYMALGLLGLTVASIALAGREPFEANLLRAVGAPFTLEADGRVRNALELHLVNKAAEPRRFVIAAPANDGLAYTIALPELELGPMAERRVPLVVTGVRGKPRKIALTVQSADVTRRIEAPFAAPR
ncbi:MAG TPA: cytochrome c oxidase accessory protein CcoG [Polyangiales bacterium]|nr:cytochrome c oxidase accessory protein CcoG [Polyangiales bacterium]